MTFEEEVEKEAARQHDALMVVSLDTAREVARSIVEERRLWRQLVEATSDAADSSWRFAVGDKRAKSAVEIVKRSLRARGVDVEG